LARPRPAAPPRPGAAGGTAFDAPPPAATAGLPTDMAVRAERAEGPADGPTVGAEAGAKISALNGLAARSGQEVRADLPDDRIAAGASLGGMIATAAAGPRHLHRPRLAETVVSMTSVGADGTIARTADGLSPALAGRALPRLLTGSWGTRAIIVAAEIELSRRPAAQQFVGVPGAEAAAALLGARQPPAAVVIERPPGSSPATVALCEGDEDLVEADIGRILDRFP